MAAASPLAPTLVIGTAGHVDHGKTSLVKALTGVDLDRLPEERERGITIALGFTPLTLPDGRMIGLVDVPGHERLVRTMVAGATGLDAVMLCVSAVEGVMPQTREHLAILELLGVRTGILVLTMADLVDAELLELATDELREQVKGGFLDGVPVIATSATTGQGLDALRAALSALVPPARDLDRPFRLPVDRSFARRGFGTVVTGTAWTGRLADGAEVEILGDGEPRRTRVRGIQVHGAARTEALAGARTALNLAGIDVETAPRGAWIVTPGRVPATRVIDVRYHHLPDAPEVEGEARWLILHGTREIEARLIPLDAEGFLPGESCLAQIRASGPLPCLPGDRFIARQLSPAATVGGGVVIDPYAPVTRRSRAAESVEILRRLEQGDRDAWLDRAGVHGLSEAEIVARAGATRGERLGDRYFSTAALAAHREALHDALAEAHGKQPLAPTLNRRSLRGGVLLSLGDREFLALLDQEVAAGRLVVEARGVRAPDFAVNLTADQEAWRAAAVAAVEAAGFDGLDDLRKAAPHVEFDALLHLLEERGEIEVVGERRYTPAVLARLVERVRVWFTEHDRMDTGAFKEVSGLTRRSAIPLLEWLDAHGYTRRVGDERVRGAAG